VCGISKTLAMTRDSELLQRIKAFNASGNFCVSYQIGLWQKTSGQTWGFFGVQVLGLT
jgi:hypothetical protein